MKAVPDCLRKAGCPVSREATADSREDRKDARYCRLPSGPPSAFCLAPSIPKYLTDLVRDTINRNRGRTLRGAGHFDNHVG
jgi:hypothetical protein